MTSVRREPIDDNDLPEMVRLFKIYSSARAMSKEMLERESKRCKIFDIQMFKDSDHWVIDRWWTEDEKIEIGLSAAPQAVSKSEMDRAISEFQAALSSYEDFAEMIEKSISTFKRVQLGNKKLFKLHIGKRVLKKNLAKQNETGVIPVFSANAIEPFGYIPDKGHSPSEYNSVLWGIDGNFNFSTIPKGRKYITTDHCGVIDILTDEIIPDYLLFALYEEKRNNDFDRSFRASLTNIKKFQIRIPIKEDGTFDIEEQNRIAADYRELCKRKERLDEAKAAMDSLLSHYTKL